MADNIAYFNGEWMPLGEVKIDPADRGFMVGDVVFDTGRTFDGKAFRMKQHIDRLYRSLKYVRIDPGLSQEEMEETIDEALRRNEHLREEASDFTWTPVITRGSGTFQDPSPATVFIRVRPVTFDGFAEHYSTGQHAVITRTRSYGPDALDPKVKHFSRMNFVLADLEAYDVEPGALAVLSDGDGYLTEGTGSNLFLVTDGVLRTPGDRSALQGVSRGMVIDLADQLELEVTEEDLQPYDLYNSDEAFFTSTSPCVTPMTMVDLRDIGDGRPGPITQQLLAAWSEAVGVDIVGQAERHAKV